jgi:hypothetical protein
MSPVRRGAAAGKQKHFRRHWPLQTLLIRKCQIIWIGQMEGRGKMTLIPKFQPDEPVCEKHHCRGFCQQCFADMVRHPLEVKIAELEKELAAKSPYAPTSTDREEVPYGMEIKPWDSLRLIGDPHKRFKELTEKGYDWHSFYHAWLEGRAEMLKEVLLDNSTIREKAFADLSAARKRIAELEAKLASHD